MKILVVEDERKVSEFLRKSLIAEGHEIFSCFDSKELNDCIESKSFEPEVVVLDRNLGHNYDSKSSIPSLKAGFVGVKILVLSAIAEPAEKAALLDMGADDYLSKPFSFVELSSRIRSLGRQTASGAGESRRHITLKDISMDTEDRRVTCQKRNLDLANKEYLLLKTFISHPRRIYNRFQLLDIVWNMQFDVESNVVEVTIKNLRRKLEAAGSELRIESKRNVGYWVEN